MTMNFILLVMMAVCGVLTVMARSLLKAAIGLAATSAIITILIFNLNSPLAAVFELSVCSGLITVVFVSAISLTKPLTHKEEIEMAKTRLRKYWYLPVLVIVSTVLAFGLLKVPVDFKVAQTPHPQMDVRSVLWNLRHFDLFGQIIIILAGAFGVVLLFKRR